MKRKAKIKPIAKRTANGKYALRLTQAQIMPLAEIIAITLTLEHKRTDLMTAIMTAVLKQVWDRYKYRFKEGDIQLLTLSEAETTAVLFILQMPELKQLRPVLLPLIQPLSQALQI